MTESLPQLQAKLASYEPLLPSLRPTVHEGFEGVSFVTLGKWLALGFGIFVIFYILTRLMHIQLTGRHGGR